jgi:CBS domain-containing protein
MKVKELMTKKIVTASKDDTISRVSELMSDYDIGFVVFVNENREPLGVVTDRDIVIRGISRRKSPDSPVEEVMTHSCIDIHRDEDAKKALDMMGNYQIRRLVVTNEEKRLVGIVSLSDLARGKYTNKLVNETLYEISIPNPQKDKPLKFLEVDDYPL